MKATTLLLVIPFFLLACCEEEATTDPAPNCVDDIITAQSASLEVVRRMDVGDEYHYWLSTGDLAFDGPEFIVNESCDTVCVYCFCPPDPCHDVYEAGEWDVYWEP